MTQLMYPFYAMVETISIGEFLERIDAVAILILPSVLVTVHSLKPC